VAEEESSNVPASRQSPKDFMGRLLTSRSIATAPIEAELHRAWDAVGPHLRQAAVPFGSLLQREAVAPSIGRHPAMDSLIVGGRMNPRQQPAFTAAANVRVDGVRLGLIPPTMLTPSPNEFRYDKTTLETRILAHALSAAGYGDLGDLNVHKRERPDFRVALADGQVVHVEVAELHDPLSAEWTNNTARIHIEANDAIDADEKQQRALCGTLLELRVHTLPTRAGAKDRPGGWSLHRSHGL
jgi:hypothetical protein